MDLNNKDIILTGFMGTGKTVVGQKLAKLLNREFMDTDHEVEKAAGKSVAAIFAEQGEDSFRQQETAVMEGLRRYPRGSLIIATGGGAVLREENRRVFRERGTVVLLTAPAEEIFRRVVHSDRPLLKTGNARERIAELLQQRDSIYRKAADITVKTEKKTPEKIAREIINSLPLTNKNTPLQG